MTHQSNKKFLPESRTLGEVLRSIKEIEKREHNYDTRLYSTISFWDSPEDSLLDLFQEIYALFDEAMEKP